MIHLAGAVLLAAGCAGLGLSAVGWLEGRVRDLRGLVAGLEGMEREMGWRQAPLTELLELAAEESGGRPGNFFRRCAGELARETENSFAQIWLRTSREGLCLAQADRLPLEQLGGVLGRYDAGSQRQALAAAARRLEEQRRAAQERRQRLGRVYGTLGITAGALLMILLS